MPAAVGDAGCLRTRSLAFRGNQMAGGKRRELGEGAAPGGVEPGQDTITRLPPGDRLADLLHSAREIGGELLGRFEREEVLHDPLCSFTSSGFKLAAAARTSAW